MSKPDTNTLDAPIPVPDSLMGASTAAPEPAAAPAETTPAEDGPADIMDFEFAPFQPPGEEPSENIRTPEPEPEPTPKAEPKTEAVSGDPAPEADQKPAVDENAAPSDLRAQVIAANDRAKEADKRLQDQKEELERIRDERTKLDEKLKTTTDAISQVEASAHPQVTAITAPFEAELANYCERLDGRGMLGNKLRQLAPQLINQRVAVGNPGEEGFEKKNQEFIDTMKQHFGDKEWENTSDMITDGARVMKRMNSKIAEITSDAERFRFEAQVHNHMEQVKQYEELEKSFGAVPPEVLATNPEDPRVLLKTLMEEIPQLKEREPVLKQHLRRVNLPLPPLDPKSMDGMTEEDKVLHMQDRLQRYEQDRLQHAAASYEGYVWRMAGPMLAKLVKNMRERATDAVRSTPAPRENAAEQTETPQEDVSLNPADFTIDPNPANL